MSSYWEDRRDNSLNKDYRKPWERDYARVVHSAGCRRLQAKTQVLGMGDGDFYRTRLTHSLEVSQIGVGITRRLHRMAKEAINGGSQTDLDEAALEHLPDPMLMSAICMAHDLGHPPFGHGGEIALNRCMLPYGGFEGNGQTLRIMARLEKYTKDYGMNLTRRAILGVIKYPAPYSEVVDWNIVPNGKPDAPMVELPKKEQTDGKHFKLVLPESSVFVASEFKPPKCYLNEEHEDVVIGWVAKELDDWDTISTAREERDPGKHPKPKYKSLDTSIMELADDIAYGVHDLEDAIGLGLIRRQKLVEWFEESDADGAKRSDSIQPLLDDVFNGSFDKFLSGLFDEGSEARKHYIGRIVGFCADNTVFEKSHPDFAAPLFQHQVVFDEDKGVRKALDTLQSVVVELVIKSTPVQQLEFKGQKMITELFNAFATDPKRLLEGRDFKQTIQGGGEICTARVICDNIAGMTDEYATKRYQQLFEPRVGSVFDRL